MFNNNLEKMDNEIANVDIYHNHADYNYTAFNENVQVVLYSVVSFLIPFVLGHPQWLVGTLVNMMLILGAQNLKGTKLFAMIFMPSLGVLSAGLLFGTLTKFLVFFIPVIWIGNITLVYGYKYMRANTKFNALNSVSAAIIAKVALLWVYAFTLVSFGIVPNLFLYTMGVFQLMTAFGGAMLALSTTRFVLSKYHSNN